MAISEEYRQFVQEQLCSLGTVVIKRMFGGAGVYAEDVMFALIADETLYFKTDKQTEPDFEAAGSEPFVYEGKGKSVRMSYWRAPDTVFDDAEEMAYWARKAINTALRAKPPPKRSFSKE